MKTILGDAKNIRELLANARFGIDDSFQRPYRWEKKHVEELIDDLTQAFDGNYEEADSREDVMDYDLYFLGSIITSDEDGRKSIVDGQQRLTTITLLLIYLYHKIESVNEKAVIAPLISSYQFGRHAYNLDVTTRNDCMDHLFTGKALSPNATDDPSVTNIIDRYQEIESVFPEEISQNNSLPYFIDWLLHKVYLVETTADTESDAYTIFETMNDRGLSLTPSEMLRGYLLTNIKAGNAVRWRLGTTALEDWKSWGMAKVLMPSGRGYVASTQRRSGKAGADPDLETLM